MLSSHFFSIEDFNKLSKRKKVKVIKLITKLENIKLVKKEILEIVLFLSSNLKKITNTVVKMWSFLKETTKNKIKDNRCLHVIKNFFFIITFQMDRHEILVI